jgi:DNA (cytosine-5)-methyltransferase 1
MLTIPEQYPDSVSITQESQYLYVSLDTILRWGKKGLVKARRTEQGHRLFSLAELLCFKTEMSTYNGAPFIVLKNETPSPYTVVELFAGRGGHGTWV